MPPLLLPSDFQLFFRFWRSDGGSEGGYDMGIDIWGVGVLLSIWQLIKR